MCDPRARTVPSLNAVRGPHHEPDPLRTITEHAERFSVARLLFATDRQGDITMDVDIDELLPASYF
jgi:hypothetical protein